MNIKIIGNGAWGNALYSVIHRNDSSVQIFGHEKVIIEKDDILVLSVPAQAIAEVLKNTTFKQDQVTIINTSKGIDNDTHLLPHQIIESNLDKDIDYYALIGPSFAKEVKSMMPTIVNLGYTKGILKDEIKESFQTDYFRVRLTKGVEALEISAAFKNVYAIACGLTQGLGYETNTRVKLMVLAIEELNRLFEGLGVKIDSEKIPGTIGDLILTCSNQESRNFAFGKLLVSKSVEDCLKEIDATVEGYNSLASVEYFKKKGNVKLPLATFVCEFVKENQRTEIKRYFDDFVRSV